MLQIKPPIRGADKWGEGKFHASRGGRLHNGVDIACYAGSVILSPHSGVVTKIGYPYKPDHPTKGHLRYVQITEQGKYRCRYFYVLPSVDVGDEIRPGDEIGVAQGLTDIYEGITDHIHFEVKIGDDREKKYLNPQDYLIGKITCP